MTELKAGLSRMMVAHAAARDAEQAFYDALAKLWQTTGHERAQSRSNVRSALVAMKQAWRNSAAGRGEYQRLKSEELNRGRERGRHGVMPYSRERSALIDEGFRLDEYLKHLRAVAVACGPLNEQAMAHVEEAIELLAAQDVDHVIRYAALDAREEAEDLLHDSITEPASLATLADRIAHAPAAEKANRTRKSATPDELRRQTSFKLPIDGGQKRAPQITTASDIIAPDQPGHVRHGT